MATDKKTGFYSLDALLKENPDIAMCFGQRGNGKTFAVLKYCLEQYKKTGKQFVYIRRWDEDVKVANMQLLFGPLDPLVKKIFGENYTIKYWQKKFFLYDELNDEREVIGHVISLTESHHQKSVAYPDVTTIFFDEFIQQSGERIVASEIQKWESVLSTIIRFRQDVKVFMMANTVSKFTQYFSYYHIPINSMSQGDIIIRDFPNASKSGKLRVACEYAEKAEGIAAETSKYIIDSNMITEGMWEIPEVSDIIMTPGEKATEKMLFSAWDPEAEVNVGCFLRTATWYTVETKNYMSIQVPHKRQFLVLRQTPKTSHYYHLTDVQDLSYSTWTNFKVMMADIEECTGINFMDELQHKRIYCDDMYTADYFNHIYKYYSSLSLRDLL